MPYNVVCGTPQDIAFVTDDARAAPLERWKRRGPVDEGRIFGCANHRLTIRKCLGAHPHGGRGGTRFEKQPASIRYRVEAYLPLRG